MRGVLRIVLAVVVVVVMGVAIVGIGQGGSEYADQPAPTGAQLQASREAIAQGGAAVQRGRREFAEEGCDACHSIAATGANGKLGPRMDQHDDGVEQTVGFVSSTMRDEDNIMPGDYAERMSPQEIQDVAEFIAAASTGAEGGGERPDGDEDDG